MIPILRLFVKTALCSTACLAILLNSTLAETAKSRTGLLAFYDFAETEGNTIADRSGFDDSSTLIIADAQNVVRRPGSLQIVKPTLIATKSPAKKITAAIRDSGEITIEAWLTPTDHIQSGPARIVTLSANSNTRNFTLGQDQSAFDARFRTTKNGTNGVPSLASPKNSVQLKLTHLVYTRTRNGKSRLFSDGVLLSEKDVSGEASNWDDGYRLALGNELSQDRPWLGTLHTVALYSRSWQVSEVKQAYSAGPTAKLDSLAKLELARSAQIFESKVAAILADRCIECHDASNNKGGLDLSQRETAFSKSENGLIYNPEHPLQSMFWEMVESDAMPLDRKPLSNEEKQILKDWLESGGQWTLQRIDPANYLHGDSILNSSARRLTVAEYIASVRVATGVDIEREALQILPKDFRADGFSNTSYNLNVDLGHVEAYALLAEKIVDQMDVLKFAERFSKARLLTDDSMRGLIEKMGQWIYRGPLVEHEIASLRGISTTVASAGGNFEEAVRYVLQAMLQSPRFLYRIESQPSGSTPVEVSPYELASRMSYIVWGAPPDQELFRLAQQGKLQGEVFDAQINRLLQHPLAKQHSADFVTDWLNLNRLKHLSPSPSLYANWDPTLAQDMRQETIMCWQELIWNEHRSLSDFLNLSYTFATPRLAQHYGLQPNTNSEENEFVRYDLSQIPSRGGVLTHGSLLTVGGDQASMVARGLFLMHDLLRGVVKDPPPCVDTTPVPARSGLTQRDIAESRMANNSCGGCHVKFEPLAFGLEQFNGIGQYQTKDAFGNSLREDGSILVPGTAKPVSYRNSSELSRLLSQSERVQQTITWKLTQFALGRPLGANDAGAVERIHATAQKQSGTYEAVLTAILKSDLVLKSMPEPKL
ncbi:DUF1592 domain-containing protein [Rubinisphaera sp.]|uniref:DUF1592 domain-containing protein n=1 Tax=Rubinisphaera sp. TaxID=2024857 RepID=UPI0025E1678F|nr:DUF1592 domain-containing protein [Rubinisphaera sp.]